ncbi:hypothetical protein CROQUDRAFT_662313 [Cronartium quercuum f. sp. fusiforme G11]|uniref:Uncharacterized protein n=1 Tax=Cronartium quercuum f. sp. fusiforme G11 TaxID=708437 RepID=A0A9P6NAH1_9BASI|nr:hypothetical protein CROQUDRAFT_662313 [Cronartium quercuum f. sp. fusiforme G11]
MFMGYSSSCATLSVFLISSLRFICLVLSRTSATEQVLSFLLLSRTACCLALILRQQPSSNSNPLVQRPRTQQRKESMEELVGDPDIQYLLTSGDARA